MLGNAKVEWLEFQRKCRTGALAYQKIHLEVRIPVPPGKNDPKVTVPSIQDDLFPIIADPGPSSEGATLPHSHNVGVISP